MKLYELFIKNLDEVNMSPSSLQSWADEHAGGMLAGFEAEMIFTDALNPEKYKKPAPESDDEGEEDDEEGDVPDYDYDEEADDIEEILAFFSSQLSIQSEERLRNKLREEFYRWAQEMAKEDFDSSDRSIVTDYIINNGRWDEKEEITAYMRDELGLSKNEIIANMTDRSGDIYWCAEEYANGKLEKRVQEALVEQNDDYDNAYYAFESDYIDHTAKEKYWLRQDQRVRWMSDAETKYNLTWPHRSTASSRDMSRREISQQYFPRPDGKYDVNIATLFSQSLEETLGVKTIVHASVRTSFGKSQTPSDVWVFEPDGSVRGDSNDLPVEIVSPPMPLDQTLKIMPKFFDWAKSKGGKNNTTTGLHMSVSVPGHQNEVLDYTKTALFLGDKHVLDLFGRAANTYCESAMEKITRRRDNMNPENLKNALDKMRSGLSDLAGQALANAGGFGKFITINPKGKYIEFRSAGGINYLNDVPKIQNTMLRYARATTLGMNIDEEKQEYAKKLYKLLTNVKLERNSIVGHTPEGPIKKPGGKVSVVPPGKDAMSKDAIWLFSQYVAGELPKTALKSFLKTNRSVRNAKKFVDSKSPVIEDENNDYSDSGYWVVYQYYRDQPDRQDHMKGLIRADSPDRAISAYHVWVNSDWRPDGDKYGIRPANQSDINYYRQVFTHDPENEARDEEETNDFQYVPRPILTHIPSGRSSTGYWTVVASANRLETSIVGIYSADESRAWPEFTHWADQHTDLGNIHVRVRPATQEEVDRAIADGVITPITAQASDDNVTNGNTFTGRWLIRDADTDQILHTFENPLNMSNRANTLAQHWLERYGPEDADMTQITVTPEFQ